MNRLSCIVALAALGLAPAHLGCGGTSSSRRVAAVKPKLPPVNPKALRSFDAALRALKLGGPEAKSKAAQRFEASLEDDGKLWEAWHNIGVIRLEEGDAVAAAEAFGKALDINPAHRPALSGRAEALRAAGDDDGARKAYRRLIEIDPNEVEAYARAASLERSANKPERALDLLREALRVKGATSEIYVELGLVYLAQGRDDLAKLVLNKAGEIDQKNPGVFNALALIAMGEGNDQLAFSYFDRAAELDPSYVDTRYNKASVLLDAGDYVGAMVELQAAAKTRPDDLGLQIALGIAQRGQGNHKKAKKIWEEVVDRATPGSRIHSDALFNLAVLEMDFFMDDAKAKAALDRYLQNARQGHAKRGEAEQLRKELGE